MGPGKKDEWYTPPEFFEAFNTIFDLDPCHPNEKTFVPAKKIYTKKDNGLILPWAGRVWMNPPFGGRNGYFGWVEKFIEHNNGIGLITSLTSSEGFQRFIPQMDSILFPSKKTKFYESLEKQGGCPFNAVVLFALGEENSEILKKSNIGMYIQLNQNK